MISGVEKLTEGVFCFASMCEGKKCFRYPHFSKDLVINKYWAIEKIKTLQFFDSRQLRNNKILKKARTQKFRENLSIRLAGLHLSTA